MEFRKKKLQIFRLSYLHVFFFTNNMTFRNQSSKDIMEKKNERKKKKEYVEER